MGIPTVLMVGSDHLASVVEYLRLRAVVVIAPSREVLIRWQQDGWGERPPPAAQPEGLLVDIPGRRIMWEGTVVPLTDLEFRVLARLASEPGRAWSYRELRRAGWGDGPDLAVDAFTVRSVIQRIRGKFRSAGATAELVSVRGFGFRLEKTVPQTGNLHDPEARGVSEPPTSVAESAAEPAGPETSPKKRRTLPGRSGK